MSNQLVWQLDDALMQPFSISDTKTFHETIISNREHLDEWLRWSSSIQTLQDAEKMLTMFGQKRQAGEGFLSGIWMNEQLVGGVVCWYIHRQNRNAEIGYWLTKATLGKGLATRASQATIDYLFSVEKLHRIEMQCAVENTRSRAIPERLGFKLEGIRRDSHWITNRFLDHAVYGLLASEWKKY